MTKQEAKLRLESYRDRLIELDTRLEVPLTTRDGINPYILDIAIECVEKQIPKKPIAREHDELRGAILFHCPTCDDDFNCNEYEETYCAECGQAIDWSDNND